MSLQNSVLEASGVDFGGLGPPFWKVLGSIFEGFGPWKPPESSSEASGLHFGRSWVQFSKVGRPFWKALGSIFENFVLRAFIWKVWALSKALDVILGTMDAKNA